jgi:hypothetical protein
VIDPICVAFIYNNKHKLEFRSKPCVFIGYSSHHKGYKCLDLETGRVYISRDVIFDEAVFPFSKSSSNFGQHEGGTGTNENTNQLLDLLPPKFFHAAPSATDHPSPAPDNSFPGDNASAPITAAPNSAPGPSTVPAICDGSILPPVFSPDLFSPASTDSDQVLLYRLLKLHQLLLKIWLLLLQAWAGAQRGQLAFPRPRDAWGVRGAEPPRYGSF